MKIYCIQVNKLFTDPQKFHWFCPHLEMSYRCLSSCTKRFPNMEKVCSENVLK